MPPKAKKGASKKAEVKKQNQLIEDKTFGLKNKNKSKSVQNYINTVQKSVKSGDRGAAEVAKNKKKVAKEAKKAQEAELAALFNEALAGGVKSGVGGKSKPGEAVAVDTKEKIVQETIIIEEGEKTLEDMIEEQRAKLRKEGKQGTPVNEETLKKWKADRKAKKLAEERRKVELEIKKRGKGKGLSVLSGRALFDYDASLFQDDADAADNHTMGQRNDIEDGEEDHQRMQGDNGDEVKESEGMAAGAMGAKAAGAKSEAVGLGVAVQEDLFEGNDDDDDDLDDLNDDDDT